jgi:hypothetical protein
MLQDFASRNPTTTNGSTAFLFQQAYLNKRWFSFGSYNELNGYVLVPAFVICPQCSKL